MERIAAYLLPGENLDQAVSLARRAEALRYESLWVTHGGGRDALLVLGAYAHVTQRVRLGSGIIPIYPRHPVAMAQGALTLAELSGGRLLLGIGVSHRPLMEQALGLPMGNPLAVMREYVAVLRGALTGKVQHEGPCYRVNWTSALPRLPAPPPIILAALSPPMLELAGEIADGVILWLCPPAYIRDVAIPAVRRGRENAGKPLDGFEVIAAVPVAATDDVEAATAIFREELVRYLSLPFYQRMLERSGFQEELAAFERDRSRHSSAGGAVPPRLAEALGGIGASDRARAFIRQHRESGVTLPAVRPIGFPEAAHYRPTLEAAAP